MLKAAIAQVVAGGDLSRQEAIEVMRQIMEGTATDAQIASLITALRMKGETVEEITGFTQVMREKAERVTLETPVLDTCGTGGDGAHTFNISTAAALVAAGAGAAWPSMETDRSPASAEVRIACLHSESILWLNPRLWRSA